jgi:hypothetical protein
MNNTWTPSETYPTQMGPSQGEQDKLDAYLLDAQAQELSEELATAEIYADSPFAHMWYLMRERGEHDRGNALHALYTSRNPYCAVSFSDFVEFLAGRS